MSFTVSDTSQESYEIIHAGIPYFGGGRITPENVFWVRKDNNVEAWIDSRPNGFSKATVRQCEMIWGVFIRTKDATDANWCNEQTLPTGIKTPIVPHDFLAHKRASSQRKQDSGQTIKLNKLSSGLVCHLKWVYNTKALPSEAEMHLSAYTLPAFILKTKCPLREAIDSAYAQVKNDPRLHAQLYSPDLLSVTKPEDLTALRYHGVPITGFVLRLWHALMGSRETHKENEAEPVDKHVFGVNQYTSTTRS
jgi:hypothetical protein